MLKLTDLVGAQDALPRNYSETYHGTDMVKMNWNECCEYHRSLLIDIDTEELARNLWNNEKLKTKVVGGTVDYRAITYRECLKIAQSLKSTAHKWLKLRKE